MKLRHLCEVGEYRASPNCWKLIRTSLYVARRGAMICVHRWNVSSKQWQRNVPCQKRFCASLNYQLAFVSPWNMEVEEGEW